METDGDVRGGKKIKRQSRDIRDRSPDRSCLHGNPEIPEIPDSRHRIRGTSGRKSPHSSRSRSRNPNENQHRRGDMRGQPESLQRSRNRGQHESRHRSSDRSHIPGQQDNQYSSSDIGRDIDQPENRDRNPGNDRGSYREHGRKHDPQVVAGGPFSKEGKRSDKNKKRVDFSGHIASETKARTPIFGAVKGFFGSLTKHRDPRVPQNRSAKLHKDRPRRGDIQQTVREISPLMKETDEILSAPHPSGDPPERPKSVLRGGGLQRRPSRAKSRERDVSPEKNKRKEPAAVETIVQKYSVRRGVSPPLTYPKSDTPDTVVGFHDNAIRPPPKQRSRPQVQQLPSSRKRNARKQSTSAARNLIGGVFRRLADWLDGDK